MLGRVQVREAAPQFWLWLFAVLAAFGVIYWRYAEGQLINQKAAVMAKQRAIAGTLGPRIEPFLKRIEAWTQELAGAWTSDQVAEGISAQQLASKPGVYLRLPLEQGQSRDTIESAAATSLRDGFTACLYSQGRAESPTQGPPCRAIGECEAGKLCNEYGVCAPPSEPFNLRMAYRAVRVLTPQWTDDLHRAENDLVVRTFEMDLQKATEHDVPLAIELLSKSDVFTLVLDENPSGDKSAEPARDGESPAERLQRLEHPVRVGIWDLQSGEQIVRLRTLASGQLISVGDATRVDFDTQAARQRQANNCAVALAVKSALGSD